MKYMIILALTTTLFAFCNNNATNDGTDRTDADSAYNRSQGMDTAQGRLDTTSYERMPVNSPDSPR